MTDVELKTPNKRKSLPAKNTSGKKLKLNKSVGSKLKTPGKSPQEQNGGKMDQIKKSPNQDLQNNSGKKQKGKISPKKIKAFSGTAAIETPKAKKIKLEKDLDAKSGENVVKRKRRSQFHLIRTKAHDGDETVVKTIEDKIKTIESRESLTKTAIRKLKLLKKLKKIAEGKTLEPQTKAPHTKSDSTKRRERKKNLKSKQIEPTVKSEQQPKVQRKVDDEEESDDDDEDNSEEGVENADSSGEEEGSEDAESGDEVEGSEDAESGDEVEGSEDEEDSDDEFEDECVPQEKVCQPGKKKSKLHKAEKLKIKTDQQVEVGSGNVQKNNANTNNQKRYVLFVGNIPFDTNKMELSHHFEKCGDVNIRIPTKRKTGEPRGFAYVEVKNETAYQKCLSLHHSFLKGRKINVLYTIGGKNKDGRMKTIKEKNFKLHAMMKKGQLVGSKKESQKRSFRRKKQMNVNSEIQ